MTAALSRTDFVSSNSSRLPDRNELGRSTQPIRVILVDDDDNFREAASGDLSDLGFDVTSFADGASMFSHLAAGNAADVIILDWKLRTGTGFDVLAQIRRRGIRMPVIFLTGMPAIACETAALDRGALDFIDKSRGVQVLARRICLLMEAGKRPEALPKEETRHCGPLMLRPKVSRAYWHGVDVDLTVTEFKIVNLLASNAGEYLTNRAIYDCVRCAGFSAGSGEDGYRTNVRSSIKRIRNKFRAVDPGFSEIENFPAFGYLWRATVANPDD